MLNKNVPAPGQPHHQDSADLPRSRSLRIELLGCPQVLLDGRPISIQRRALRCLLFYLACQPRPVGREALLVLFWPEESESKARQYLRDSLNKLRKQLSDSHFLVVNGNQVWIDYQRVTVDVLEFRQLVEQTRRIADQITPPAALPLPVQHQMVQAVGLWRAGRFLAGADLSSKGQFDEWVQETSQELETERFDLLVRLAEDEAARGNLEMALRWGRSAAEMDELDERLQYHLLTWQSQLGRWKEALSHYNHLQRVFQQEGFGRMPPALQEVGKALKERVALPEAADSLAEILPLTARVPFVGRVEEIQRLKLALSCGQTVAVLGEAGAGKTRLVVELLQGLSPQPRLLLLNARPLESNLPFQPFIDMLRRAVQPAEWQALAVTWIKPLRRLLPELATLRPEVPPDDEATLLQARSQLFEALHQLLRLLADGRRILLFLDDAQWADEATLGALAYLQERYFFPKYGWLVLAARLEESNPSLEDFLEHPYNAQHLAPARSEPVYRVELDQLQPAEIAELAAYVLGKAPSQPILERLSRDTGGNPLFLLETLRLMLETAPGQAEEPDHLPLAVSMHLLLRDRVQKLDSPTRQVLSIAAVIGKQFSPALIEVATGFSAEQVARALEDLQRAHLVQAPAGSDPLPAYSIIHEKVREILNLELSPARKRALHLRAAQALEKLGSQPAAVLAHHYEAAGELEKAFQHWLQAGQHARRLLSLDETYAAFRNAENLLRRLDFSLSDSALYELYTAWGEVAYDVSDHQTMKRVYSTLLRLGEQRASQWLVGTAYSGLANLSFAFMQPSLGLQQIERAMAHLEQTGDLYEQINGYGRWFTLLISTGRYPEAFEVFEKIQAYGARAKTARELQALADAQQMFAMVSNFCGRPIRALEYAQESLRNSERTFYEQGKVRALATIAFAQLSLGMLEESLTNCQQTLSRAEAMQNWRIVCYIHSVAGWVSYYRGSLDECWQRADRMEEINQQYVAYADIQSTANTIKGDIFLLLEDYAQARKYYEKGVLPGTSYQAMESRWRLGYVMVLNGDAQGKDLMKTVIDTARQIGLYNSALKAEAALLMLEALGGQYEPARARIGELEKEWMERQMWPLEMTGRMLKILLALADGNLDRAQEGTQALIHRGLELSMVWGEIHGLQFLHQILKLRGQEDPYPAQRTQQLLERLEQQSHHPEIRAAFERYAQRLLARLA